MNNVRAVTHLQRTAQVDSWTCRETLVMAARLRLPADMPDAEKEERVEALIKRLGLTGAADTVVGDEKVSDARGVCAHSP